MKCKGEYNMLYTVSYFNPLGNCDDIVHIEVDFELEACLIAHADFHRLIVKFDSCTKNTKN